MTIAFRSNYGIYAMNDDGTNIRRLLDDSSDTPLSLSPDGSEMIFTSNRNGNSDVYRMSAIDGSNLRNITTTSSDEIYAIWEGNHILYVNSSGLFVMNSDGTNLSTLGVPTANMVNNAVSRDGNHFAYVSQQGGQWGLDIANNDGTNSLRRISTLEVGSASGGPVDLDGDNFSGVCWSPDASKLIFSSGIGNATELFVINADGTGKTQLTHNESADFWCQWSPDGTKVAFQIKNVGGNFDVGVMNTDGSGYRNLTNTSSINEFDPVWSPDSTSIAFISNNSMQNVKVDGSGLSQLIDGSFSLPNDRVEWEGIQQYVDPLLGGSVFVTDSKNATINLGMQHYINYIGLAGGTGSDELIGNSLDNQIWGGTGNSSDCLRGGSGSDIYWFGKNDGHDTIAADAYNSLDSVNFYDSMSTDIVFRQSGTDLIVSLGGTGSLNIQGWYDPANAANRVMHATFANGERI